MLSHVVLAIERPIARRALKRAWSNMLRVDMTYQCWLAGEGFTVVAVLPMAIERALGRSTIMKAVNEI